MKGLDPGSSVRDDNLNDEGQSKRPLVLPHPRHCRMISTPRATRYAARGLCVEPPRNQWRQVMPEGARPRTADMTKMAAAMPISGQKPPLAADRGRLMSDLQQPIGRSHGMMLRSLAAPIPFRDTSRRFLMALNDFKLLVYRVCSLGKSDKMIAMWTEPQSNS